MPRHSRRQSTTATQSRTKTKGAGLWNFIIGKKSPPTATLVPTATSAAIPVATQVVSDPSNPTPEDRQRQQLMIIYDRLHIDPTLVDTEMVLDAVNGRPRTVNGMRLSGRSPLDRQIMLKTALQRLTPPDKYRFLSVIQSVFPSVAMPAGQLLLDAQATMSQYRK